MAAGKQTPRQKLIGLMYLVFLALMALNVSVEVLDSFVLVDDGIAQTNKNFESKVEMVYSDFVQQKALSEERVQPFFDEAMQIQAAADRLADYLKTSRIEMIAVVNDITYEEAEALDLIDMKRKDQYSRTSRYYLTEGNKDPARLGGEGSRAYEMKTEIEAFKDLVTDILSNHGLDDIVQIGLNTEGPFYSKDRSMEVSWEQMMFDRVIPVAVATNLNLLITDVRNAEFDAINLLYGAITADDFKFDQIAARVVPSSQIVLLGDNYEADIFVAAYDSRQNPEVIVDGRSIRTEDGVGKLRIPTTSTGPKRHTGVIRVLSPAGIPQDYNFAAEYIVQRPSVTVSADAMNVFYIGVDNPVSISAPGITTENLRPTISAGGSLIRQPDGTYIVRMQPNTRNATVTVNALVDGTLRSMGTSSFRVRNVPDPVAYIANRREGRVSRDELLIARGIIPRMENFEFDMNFEIESFTMVTTISGDVRTFRTDGNLFSQEMIQIISNATRGQRIQFENITTRPGPDNRVRSLAPISFTIN